MPADADSISIDLLLRDRSTTPAMSPPRTCSAIECGVLSSYGFYAAR